ncbi:Helix-turn-helix domain-containing protein [Streptomyces sp. 3213]|uniref:helix-turn-helix domain-containing protein n=1 Tax=Streptomyces sp. 3213.3 TaxID=1855348 RepID=UPI00089D9206|nr:helix-turn-helix transcriptional regulator [Streptomyces sp. 3213.3]SED75641.1 Helix-turn-helix domain-containing protein [Streptomyces sp. 3213] [Streptomyces sp. 3213.3]
MSDDSVSNENEGVDEAGWDLEPGDESAPLVEAVGRFIKFCRERARMTVADFAQVMGYGEDMIRKLERGVRIPRVEFLDRADDVLNAGGHLRAFREDVEKAQYPKKVRDLKKKEDMAVELQLYSNHNIHGLLQTPEYARALLGTWRPAYSQGELERMLAGRMARKSIFEREPAPELSFVQEEVTLRRPVGGTMVLRRQLEHMLEVAQLPYVELQVMPTARASHPGTGGRIQVLKFADGSGAGRMDDDFGGRPVDNPRQLRVLELRYGIIRAQALTPEESLAFIEQVLGET